MKVIGLLFLFCLAGPAGAGVYEYKVIYLPSFIDSSGVRVDESAVKRMAGGGMLDVKKTKILNDMAGQGWELVTVTGAAGADQAAYFRKLRD